MVGFRLRFFFISTSWWSCTNLLLPPKFAPLNMKMEIFFLEMERRAQNLFLTSKSAVHFIKEWDPLVLWNALASRERKFHAPSSKNVHIKCTHCYHSTHTLLLLMASKIDKKLALIAANEHSRSAATAPTKFSDPETQIRKTTFWLEKHTVTRQM